jgi:hypothetical protein
MDNLQLYVLKFPHSFSLKEHQHYFPGDVVLSLFSDTIKELQFKLV